MKRLVASIGAAAIGSTALQQAEAASLSAQERTKPWSVALALRGFYDDNYLNQARDNPDIPSSFGFEIRPTLGLNVPLEQTYLGLDLTYSAKWYEDRSDNQWDQSFLADAMLNHSFSELVALEIQDRFVYSERPELTDPTFGTVRVEGNNINNRGDIAMTFGLSPRLGLVVGYQNLFWDYENDNPAAENNPIIPTVFGASLSATLDRIQSLIPVNLRYQAAPATVVLVGYNFGMVNYTSDEYLYDLGLVTTGFPSLTGPKSDSRNYNSHYGYIGVEHNFTPLLNLGVRGGAQYSDFYNSANSQTSVTPYGDISLSYTYTTGSQAEVGYTLSQAATDQTSPDGSGNPTLNRLVSSVYGRVDHQFIPQLHGGVYAQWQLSSYNGGALDGETDNLYLLGVSLRYRFNQFLAADVGYTFDYLDTPIPNRGFTANRVHIGLTASY